MCNSSRGEKSESSAPSRGPPPGVLVGDSDSFRWLETWGTGKAGPLAVVSFYSPECVEGEFSEVRRYGVLRSSTPDTQATLARAWIRFIRFSLVQVAIVHRSEAALPVLPLALS